ncbi:hypothetical protein [Paenibacillus castaneae]|nr:hypothetical protein [Paenibacillus castaneae]
MAFGFGDPNVSKWFWLLSYRAAHWQCPDAVDRPDPLSTHSSYQLHI